MIKLTFPLIFLIVYGSALLAEDALTIDDALERTLSKSFNLTEALNESESKRNLVKQARLLPNPVFTYEVEDFAGDNEWVGWHNREERYIVSQLIETACKRELRTQAANYQYYAALVGYDISKLLVLNRLHRAFLNVVAAQEWLALSNEQAGIAKEVLRIATKKVEAGKVSLIQQNKAEVAYTTTLIEVDKAIIELKTSKRRLSLQWAEACPDFEEVTFPFYDISSPDTFEECLANLCNQPEVVQSLYQYLNNEKTWRLELANGIPDLTIELGYKANYRERNQGMITGIALPIPLFNQNQGNVGRAYYDMLKTGDQGRQLWLVLESKLAITYEELIRAYDEAVKIRDFALPSSEKAYKLAHQGYIEGKFEYLDVLDAQRTLYEVKAKYIQALLNYHTKHADIEFLNSQVD